MMSGLQTLRADAIPHLGPGFPICDVCLKKNTHHRRCQTSDADDDLYGAFFSSVVKSYMVKVNGLKFCSAHRRS